MSELRLTVLGCSGSYPGPGAACSGYLVQGGGVNVVLDLGPGSLANLQQHVPLGEIDAVVLSHRHADHWIDLTGLTTASHYTLQREGIPVYGTADTRAAAAAIVSELEPTLDWHELHDGAEAQVGELRFRFSATEHYVDTLAVRIDAGGTALAYSADTGPGWSFGELGAATLDLALCEATTLQDEEGDGVLHLSARQAGAMARASGVRRLLLTHLHPNVDRAASQAEGEAAYGAPVQLAHEHAVVDL